jgi:hypothetical protein
MSHSLEDTIQELPTSYSLPLQVARCEYIDVAM